MDDDAASEVEGGTCLHRRCHSSADKRYESPLERNAEKKEGLETGIVATTCSVSQWHPIYPRDLQKNSSTDLAGSGAGPPFDILTENV
jgi:hypothetical protein